jgi:zinc protease
MMNPAIPGPHNIIIDELSNGLRVWVYENFESQTISLQGYVPGGSINESPQQTGLANLTALMLRRGAGGRSYDMLNEIIEAVGASFDFDTGRHTLGFDTYSLAEDFDLPLSLLAQSLKTPDFPETELEKSRKQLLARLEERKHSTNMQALLAFRQHLYAPGHPYRSSFLGEEATLQQFTRKQLITFYHNNITPAGGIVVVVGALPATEIMARLEQALGDWRHPHARPDDTIPPTPRLTGKIEVSLPIPGKSQSTLLLGWPSIPVNHPDYFSLLLCNSILGQFGLGGRLGQRVRETLGLAYSINSSFTVNRGAGTIRISAGVNPANIGRALEAIFHELGRIRNHLVTPQELEDVQRHASGSLPLRLETNNGIGSSLINMAWYNSELDYLLTYAEKIWAVTREDVLRVARKYFDLENYVLVTAGPPPEEA